MSVIVVCDSCGSQDGKRYYLALAIGEGKGTRNVRKGDLCDKCVAKLPLTEYEPVRKGKRGPYGPRAVAA